MLLAAEGPRDSSGSDGGSLSAHATSPHWQQPGALCSWTGAICSSRTASGSEGPVGDDEDDVAERQVQQLLLQPVLRQVCQAGLAGTYAPYFIFTNQTHPARHSSPDTPVALTPKKPVIPVKSDGSNQHCLPRPRAELMSNLSVMQL